MTESLLIREDEDEYAVSEKGMKGILEAISLEKESMEAGNEHGVDNGVNRKEEVSEGVMSMGDGEMPEQHEEEMRKEYNVGDLDTTEWSDFQ